MTPSYPKRLIEVDLPIRRISAHARREKSIRHGHISTLHIWWARRPLAACRAVICASLWPDPADPQCPAAFIATAKREMLAWTTHERQSLLSAESRGRFVPARTRRTVFDDPLELRRALLDFIADFANWDNSTKPEFLATSRALTESAHVALGGEPGTRPLVVDPFCGGGSIPLEALRVGADAFASDLNPIPVLLNKVVLEYIPKYGQRLADEVRKWGAWIKEQAEQELAEFYPKDPDGATPIAYLWARTIQCEGPGCGAEVPLIRSLWLAKKDKRAIALQLTPNPQAKRVDFHIIVKNGTKWFYQSDEKSEIPNPKFEGTVKRGSATCPCCGYTTPVASVRKQLKTRRGGTDDALLFCVVSTRQTESGRFYRTPADSDHAALQNCTRAYQHLIAQRLDGEITVVPTESTEEYHSFVNRGPIYGMKSWDCYYSPRQTVALAAIAKLIRQAATHFRDSEGGEFADALQTCLSLNFGRLLDLANSLCGWTTDTQCVKHLFARQAMPMVWNFAESVPIGQSAGSWSVVTERFPDVLVSLSVSTKTGHAQLADATKHPLPSDSIDAVITDPPYYYSVQYADLADFFYVWLRRTLHGVHAELLKHPVILKDREIIVQSPGHEFAAEGKNNRFYERLMGEAMGEARRGLKPSGIAIVVFAHTSTSGWEAQLQAMVNAGWVLTGSWPIDTEMASRIIAQGRSVLASSVHLVCRPRENPDGAMRNDEIGDWRDVLQELPQRIHEWMPRLALEGVVGADAIFACLGPALEIFSRYARVEKASGDVVTLKEYLEHVWAAVSKEALSVIFEDADTEGFEPDSRLTAMWLWTLSAGGGNDEGRMTNDEEDAEEDEDGGKAGKKKSGFALEYDAARKIAQGLGAHLEDLRNMVEVSGETARLLPVAERMAYLFGKDQAEEVLQPKRKKKPEQQPDLFAELAQEGVSEQVWTEKTVSKIGETTLDRVHQSMILFAASRSEALKRFLVDDGAGKDQKFWRLAQALSALYPPKCEEKRWVDGVLARKKGLGF